jgi:hypothetical protein
VPGITEVASATVAADSRGRIVVGYQLQGTAYFVGFYELDEAGAVVVADGTDGGVREVLGWLATFSARLDRHRVVVAGDAQTFGSSVRVRQYGHQVPISLNW